MQDFIPEWLFNSLSATAILVPIGFLFRETLSNFFTKSVEHRFDTKLEKAKAELRAHEKELDHIREYLSLRKRERDSVVQAKRIEAAETVLRVCDTLAQLSMALETMKILNIEEMSKEPDKENVKKFFETILEVVKADDKFAIVNKMDQTGPKLYLSQRAMDYFYAYKSIISYPILYMKFMSISAKDAALMKPVHLRKEIERLVPTSKKGFEKYGEGYAFYWAQYCYNEILKSLRAVANGEEQDKADVVAIGELSITSQMTQIEVRKKFSESGLSPRFIVEDPDVPELPVQAT